MAIGDAYSRQVAAAAGISAARRTLALAIPEKDFQATVMEMAERFGWRCYHSYDSRFDRPGFPDLTMTRQRRLIFAELKTAKGSVTPEQQAWLSDLSRVPSTETYVWRTTDDWAEIEAILR